MPRLPSRKGSSWSAWFHDEARSASWASQRSCPRELVLRQAAAGIEDPDLMGQAVAPDPQDEIDVVWDCSTDKARGEHAGRAAGKEASSDSPGRRLAARGSLGEPWARKILLGDARRLPVGPGPKVDQILAVNFVCAEHAGFEFVGKTLRGLFDRRHRIEGDIECRRSLGIEAPAVGGGPVA